MKMKPEHFAFFKAEINKVLAHNPGIVDKYNAGNFPRAGKVKDLQKRFCYDVLYSANLATYMCDVLYLYLNDDHIYTALRRICPTVTRQY